MATHSIRIAFALLMLQLAACTVHPPVGTVPAKLQPAVGARLAMVVPAVGVQVYECRARQDATSQFVWTFAGPEADLYDTQGRHAGKHYSGPHWEAPDGSRIVGSLKERADAPSADAIPWLLLNTRSAGPSGRFSMVTAVQRVNTVGGVAPDAGCSQSNLGAMARVPYTADYFFYTGS